MKTALVLDYPSEFDFPPVGYGGIERWLYTIAESFKKLGYEVVLSGPQWRKEVLEGYNYFNNRILEKLDAERFLEQYGKVDFLVGGHEYWHNEKLRKIFESVADKSFSFQHMPNPLYKDICYDNQKHFLFCYSDEMVNRFSLQKPKKSICYTMGYNEYPKKGKDEGYLVWLGRIDKDKSPHYAIKAAINIGIPIKIIGTPIYDSSYYDEYKDLFSHPLVEFLGTRVGEEKMDIISNATCGIYTLDKDYIESGVATIGEFIASGVPCAGITWKGNDCVVEGVGENEYGDVFKCENTMGEQDIINGLKESINNCLNINREKLFEKGQKKYNPTNILDNMINTISK